jgi:hypothetical protein
MYARYGQRLDVNDITYSLDVPMLSEDKFHFISTLLLQPTLDPSKTKALNSTPNFRRRIGITWLWENGYKTQDHVITQREREREREKLRKDNNVCMNTAQD